MSQEKENFGFQVYSKPCYNCLLSKNAIVPPQRVKEIIEQCKEDQTHFICHKSSIKGGNICCKKFYDQLGHVSNMIRVCERLGAIKFVDHSDNEKLPSYRGEFGDIQKGE